MRLKLIKVDDIGLQENFRRLEQASNNNGFLKGDFKFVETTFGRSSATFPLTVNYKHNLSFVPKDVILMNFTGGTISFNYANFDEVNISVTVSAVVTARFFLGRYGENT